MCSVNHEKLVVWQKAMDLVVNVYELSRTLPNNEQFGLISQLRRAAVSVPSNIAEGNARISKKEYIRFLSIARGSVAEVETQLEICERLNYLEAHEIFASIKLCEEINKIISALIRNLNSKL